MVTRLIQNDVHPHKNLKSLDSYAVASETQQKAMSTIISCKSIPPSDITNIVSTSTATQISRNVPNGTGFNISGNNVVNSYYGKQ